MEGFKEYDQYDGLGLADLVKKKDVSPKELLEEAIKRIEEYNPKLNAVILPMYDYARKLVEEDIPEGAFPSKRFAGCI